ncbi:MAG: hypothetical protein CMP39_01615 [Rickettsiales bacterium]|nr:hypothetical protein [Rickettsiales bacterium]|tara:strand:- start:4215 stop:5483 length:1269 start_codon:yes stop_codon:yes gene_type:complete
MKKFISILMVFIGFYSSLIFAELPISKEANLIEQVSPREVIIESTGIYYSEKFRKKADVRRNGYTNALIDAQKSAIYYLLFKGSDPIISNFDEEQRFKVFENLIFSQNTLTKFITFTDPKARKITLNKGKGLKIITKINVNKFALQSYLEENAVVFSKDELTELLGYPQIMVIPQGKTNQTPLQVLTNDENAKHAAGVLESYLTNNSYDVIVPNQTSDLNTMIADIYASTKNTKDSAYELALSIGADIYFDYSIVGTTAAYSTTQYSVTIRAFETTTGRLLGSETGYSKSRKGQDFVSIEEATLSALGNVINRVLNYWEDDLSKGTQYKVIAQIDTTALSSDDVFELQENIFKILEQYSNWTKENIVTNKTIDVLMWCDPEEYPKSRHLTRSLMKDFKQYLKKFDFELITQNRKLILFNIKK